MQKRHLGTSGVEVSALGLRRRSEHGPPHPLEDDCIEERSLDFLVPLPIVLRRRFANHDATPLEPSGLRRRPLRL